jgi:hypothetical protein
MPPFGSNDAPCFLMGQQLLELAAHGLARGLGTQLAMVLGSLAVVNACFALPVGTKA